MSSRTLPPLMLTALLAALTTGNGRADDQATPEQAQFFESQVRPVLVNECAKCHDGKKHKGGLRVDSRAALLTGGDSGPAVVPGKPAESLLVAAIKHEGPEMPPSGKLPPPKIEALTRWVQIGAPWPGAEVAAPPVAKKEFQITDQHRRHWAFQPVQAPAVPQVRDRAWVANPIDAFILARLETKGFRPNPAASKVELLRRATYDLTGLPPTPKEVDRFLADESPGAYEQLIDRLLDSPRYGEKWGRHWLDLVRYAETNSYERDNPKPNAWRYRDYVIRSLNQDKPYDRFIREQLAGDELPDGGNDGLIATGYYRLGIWDDEPTDRDQARYDGIDDLVATTAQVFCGLTVDCARCHDHKIDPIPQKDYYRFVSFFQNVNHFRNGGPTDEQPLLTRPGDRERYAQAVEELNRRRDAVQSDITELEEIFRQNYAKKDAGPVRRPDLDDLRYRYYRDTWDKLPDFTLIKPEDSGVLPRGLFDLGPRTRVDAFGFVFEGVLIVPENGSYHFFVDSDDGARLTVGDKLVLNYDGIHGTGHEQEAEARLEPGRVPVRLEYFQRGNGFGLSVAWSGPNFVRRTLSATTETDRPPVKDVAQLIRTEGKVVLGAEKAQRYRELRRELSELSAAKVPAEMALCVSENGPSPPDTFVLARGNPHVPGEKVEPGFLAVLGTPAPSIPTPRPGARTSGRRTVLADWIASPDNPLTARVMANRVWQYHFGRGIVRSPSNYGTQGDKPTHPELLDWLAAEFIKQGWHLKPLHRLIMTSQAYRMSSRGQAEPLAQDPTNDLFWRFDMRRLTAEEIRDSVHAVCGDLNLAMYGPGFYTEVPAEVMAGQSVPGKGWGKSPPAEIGRRSIYIHVKRSLLTPILESFDAAEVDRSSPSRFSTTQPTQALAMLNSRYLTKQAGTFAARLRREAGDDVAKQVELALRLVTCRPTREDEVRRGVDLIDSFRKRDGLDEGTALKTFCLVVLNLNEFVFLD